jgi:large subunit ribosomal protein L13
MNTLSYRTVSVSAEKAERKWYVIDATNLPVGRLCTQVASVLRGKNKPSYTPHADTGDYVIVVNADKVRFTGKKWAQKEYKDFSLHPGGLRLTTAEALLEKDSRRIVERAVKGMLPKNTLGRQMQRKLFVYSGAEHKHAAQKPEVLESNAKVAKK